MELYSFSINEIISETRRLLLIHLLVILLLQLGMYNLYQCVYIQIIIIIYLIGNDC